MNTVDVLWLIEHTVREMDVAAAVKAAAGARHGLRVRVAPLGGDLAAMARAGTPAVVAVPYGFSIHNARIPEILDLWPDATIFNLSWEELYYHAYREARAPSDGWSRRGIVHHAWGDFFRDYLTAHGVTPATVFVNGQPAYALYERPYRALFEDKARLARSLGLDPQRRWIFFPENYGWAFKTDAALAKLVKAHGMSRDDLEVMRSWCAGSLAKVIRWLAEMVEETGAECILRPRPATGQTRFEEFVRQVSPELPPRLRITQTATVREWILASDVTLSSISTSLLEAAVAGKPAYMVEPEPIPHPLQDDWHAHAPRIADKAALFDVCAGRAGPTAGGGLARWARENLLSRGDPIVGLADFLADLSRRGRAHPACPDVEWREGAGPLEAARDFGQTCGTDLFDDEAVEARADLFRPLFADGPDAPPMRRAAPELGEGVWLQRYAGFDVAVSWGTSLMTRLKRRDDVYEPETIEALSRTLAELGERRFLDVGANIGLVSLALLARFTELTIDAFEPGPHQADLLDATVRANGLEGRLRQHRLALAGEDGQAVFHIHASEHASGDGFMDTGRAGPAERIAVKAARLDSWWRENGRPHIGLVKMDAEGGELAILRGAAEFLAAVRPVVFLEITNLNLKAYPHRDIDVHEWLLDHGYLLETMDGRPVTSENREEIFRATYNFRAFPMKAPSPRP